MLRIVALVALLAAAGCAPVTKQPQITDAQAAKEAELQAEMAVERIIAATARVDDIYHPIRRANADQCGDKTRYTTGMRLLIPSTAPELQRPAYTKRYGADDGKPVVMTVAKGSTAEAAGIRPGDRIVTADPAALVKALNTPKPTRLDLVRAGQPLSLELATEKVCDYPVEIQGNELVNAFADGSKIIVTTGMIGFAAKDEELALVLGHELGHNTMDHIAKKKGNVVVGAIIGGILQGIAGGYGMADLGAQAGAGAFSQEFEGEADYVGVYYAARAGYDVANATQLWRRMGAAHPTSIHLEGSSHPSTAKRFMAIEEAVKEIEDKRTRGEALVPDMKEGGAQ